ncbi:MAG: HDOD domain-containing protein [Pseudomonadota bacterium]
MSTAPDPQATLALMWERIRTMGDMHGFTRTIGEVLGAMRGEQEQEFNMTRTVLSDPVLTQKVLRLANSGMYSAFGQRINTVTKAVLVLGTDAIGQLALGLKAIEELASQEDDAPVAHVEMEKAILAGMVARQVAASAAAPDPEEAVVCSMLHMLGRMLVSFYLPERWAALQSHGGAGLEDAAALAVLGVSMEDIGRAAAVQWGLPKDLVGSMRRVEPAAAEVPLGHDDWLAALSTMSAQCADSLWHDDEAGVVAVRALAGSFSSMLGVAPDAILTAIETAREVAAADLTLSPVAMPAVRRARAQAATRLRTEGNQMLAAGVADMRGVLSSATPSQMMSMALETLYQGLSLTRAVAFLRNRRDRKYRGKLSFGEGVAEMLPQLEFDDGYEANVFHAALGSDRVIFIADPREPKFAAKLPGWWIGSLKSARSFVILPICVNGQPAGLIYGDWDDSYPPIALSQTEFGLLNELRGTMVKSLELRTKVEAANR